MRSASLIRTVAIALIFILLDPPLLPAGSCQQRAEIRSGVDVYKSLPKFVTGLGWRGDRQRYLTKGTQVYICGEQKIEFGLSSKIWAKIAYRDTNGFQFGWVMRENVADWHAWRRDNGSDSYFGFVAVAFAAEPTSREQQSKWTLGNPPTETPPNRDPASISTTDNTASATLDDLFALYAPLFIAMLIGMIAKAAVDWLDVSDRSVLREHVRNAVTAFLVSPIVFLGFLNAGQFSTSRQTFIVLCLLAFQNGFFWQTVLKKDSHRVELNALTAAAPGGTR